MQTANSRLACSQIVAGGGWKDTHVEKVKIKAWTALFASLGLGAISVVGADSIWIYASVPASTCLLAAIVLFFCERAKEIEFPGERAGHDPRNLYSASGLTKLTL